MALVKYIDVPRKTAWTVSHKLRNASKEHEALYKLCGLSKWMNLALADQNITVGSTIHRDAFRFYNTLSGKYDVRMEKYDSEDTIRHHKQIHGTIPNIKANIEEHIT